MSNELQNIPFFWTAAAHWMATMLYAWLLPRRLAGWRAATVGLLSLAVMQAFMYITAPQDDALFNFLMAVFALLTLLPLVLLCRLNVRQLFYFGTRAFILGGFAASISWQLYIYSAQRILWMGAAAVETGYMLVFFCIICAVMYLLERPRSRAAAEMPISWLSCLSTVAIGVVIYIVSSLSFAPVDTPFGGSTYAEAFNIRSIVYLGGVAILFAYHVMLSESHIRLERDTLAQMLNMQYMNYRLSQESVDLINQKYHDLKHQIAILRSEIGAEQKLDYLDRMEQEIGVYEAQNKTGNRYLDTILTGKSIHCQNEGIKLTCVANGEALDFMDVMDLSALFGNALDNAIEAVSQISDPEQRLIHLSVSRQKDFLRIRVENRYEGKLTLDKGLPVTTKQDSLYHGFGIKSIVTTAEKYGGSATFHTKDGWFELRVLIPAQK